MTSTEAAPVVSFRSSRIPLPRRNRRSGAVRPTVPSPDALNSRPVSASGGRPQRWRSYYALPRFNFAVIAVCKSGFGAVEKFNLAARLCADHFVNRLANRCFEFVAYTNGLRSCHGSSAPLKVVEAGLIRTATRLIGLIEHVANNVFAIVIFPFHLFGELHCRHPRKTIINNGVVAVFAFYDVKILSHFLSPVYKVEQFQPYNSIIQGFKGKSSLKVYNSVFLCQICRAGRMVNIRVILKIGTIRGIYEMDGNKSAGRPTIYSPELRERICRELASGRTLRSICRDDDMPDQTTVWEWLRDCDNEVMKEKAHVIDGFSKHYAVAREEQAENIHDEVFEIADDGSNDFMEIRLRNGENKTVVDRECVARSKLRVETRMAWLANTAPRKYGKNNGRTEIQNLDAKGQPADQPGSAAASADAMIAMTQAAIDLAMKAKGTDGNKG